MHSVSVCLRVLAQHRFKAHVEAHACPHAGITSELSMVTACIHCVRMHVPARAPQQAAPASGTSTAQHRTKRKDESTAP
eukprot:13967513-Alexandrium_andersonii.AAC.1